MDEQELDVIENAEPIDVDGPDADPRRRRSSRERTEEMRIRAEELRMRAEGLQRQAVQLPFQVLTGVIRALPVQTREHLRQSARESVLAVTSLVDAVGSAALLAVDRLYADPRTPRETAQPRRIIIEREDELGSPS